MKDAFAKAGIRLNIAAGDIVTVKDNKVRFPLNLIRKFRERRFCLVMSNRTLCDKYDVISIAPLSTRTDIKAESDHDLQRTATNGLERDSVVQLGEIQSIDRGWIIEKMGSLSNAEWQEILKQLSWNLKRN